MPLKYLPFNSMLFGFAFSPNLEVNILETTRLAHFFGSRLILLHVGSKTPDKEAIIEKLLARVEYRDVEIDVQWREGEPFKVISEACLKLQVDLLVLGALQHENIYQFYVGSIARKLTRHVCCSVLLLIKPSAVRVACKHVVVNGLDEPETPLAITTAIHAANALGAQQLTVVEEIRQSEIHVTVEDDRSLKRANIIKERLKHREESRVRRLIRDLPSDFVGELKIKNQSIFGKRGYSLGHYAEVVRADLLVMNSPKKSGFLDRVFTHDIEYILSDLPTDLLIIRERH